MGSERPDKWQYKRLSEICDVINYGYTQSASKEPIGPKFLRITDIQKDWIDWSTVPYCQISESDKDKYILNEGDIVIARTGASTGQNAYISNHPEAVFASYLVRLKINESHNSRYVSYFLRSQFYKDFIEGAIGGSAQPNASAKTLTLAKLLLPPLPEQQKIASILSAFDDKIELNNQMNRTLEEMASAIFKSWFVDFEPFQDGEFEYNEEMDKEIPKEWEVKRIGEVCKTFSGGTPKTNEQSYWDGGDIYWATPTDITALSSPIIFDTARKITQLGLEKSSAKMLPVGAVLMTSRATLGHFAISKVPIATNQGFISIVCGDYPSNYFMMYSVKQKIEQIIGFAGGSTYPEINKTAFRSIQIILPPRELVRKFDKIVESLYNEIYENERENKTLAQIRDALLPKLLSGEIRVNSENILR